MDDSALAVALARRDPLALDEAYRRYADRLFAFAQSLVGDRDIAADIVQDTFLLASEHAGQLRDPARLRPWLYAIARNAGMRRLRSQAKQYPVPQETFDDRPAEAADPLTGLRSAEIAELVWAAHAGIPPNDREIIELSVRHGLSSSDIAGMLDISVNHVNARLSRARANLADCIGVLLVARAETSCATLTDLLKGWDGKLTPVLRARLRRHIEKCIVCGEVRRRRMNPAALLAGYASAPFPLAPMLIGDRAAPHLDLASHTSTPPVNPRWSQNTGFPAPPRQPNQTMAFGAGVLLLVLCGIGAAGAWAGGSLLGAAQPTSSPAPMATGPQQPDLVDPGPSNVPSDSAPSPSADQSPASVPSPKVSTVTVSPAGQQKPTATITKSAPSVDSTTVQFAGKATDPEDGALPGTRLRWTAYAGGQKKVLCVGSAVPGVASRGDIAIYRNCASFTTSPGQLSGGMWNVVLEAFDSTTRVGTDSVKVQIYVAG